MCANKIHQVLLDFCQRLVAHSQCELCLPTGKDEIVKPQKGVNNVMTALAGSGCLCNWNTALYEAGL
jgi:hypothetical protein